MISKYMKTLYCWLLEMAQVPLSWLRHKYPVAWEGGLDSLQQFVAGHRREAGHALMKRRSCIANTLLVV